MSRVSAVLVASLVLSAVPPANAQVQGGTVPGVAVPDRPQPPPRPPARDQPQQTTGTARISGLVVSSEDNRPLRRAAVRVSAPELREPRAAMTDASGRYELADLPAGRYMVTVSRAGFVTISHGQTRPNEMGRPLDVKAGQTVDRINFALPRGAAITGRVVDEFGEPVAGVSVQPMQLRWVNGRQQPQMTGPGGMMQTPDTGEFRVWGLAPGDYVVQANVMNMGGPFETDDRSGYTPTYFPNATDVAQAQTVRVELGQTVTGLEIMLSPTRTARISGRTMDSRGQPLKMGMAMAMPQRSEPMGMMSPRTGPIRPDGTFTINGVTPGNYVVRAMTPNSTPGAPPEALIATVTVSGDDVSDVILSPQQPVTITGRILFDPPTQALEASAVRVMATPKMPGTMIPMPMTGPPIVNDDFTFEVKGPPGELVVRVTPMNNPNWTMKSVMHDNRDITEEGLTAASGSTVKDVEVVLTNRFQTVSGVVTNQRGDVVTDVTVFVFPQDRDRWFPRPASASSTATGRPDQNGRYSLRTRLQPGDYYAVAVEYLDPNRRGGDPGYLEELSKNATSFTIREEETKAIDLRVAR